MAAADPVARRLSASQAALTRWSKQDTKAGTEPARRGRTAKYAREVDPEGLLSPGELAVRVDRAMRADMTRMSGIAKSRRAGREAAA